MTQSKKQGKSILAIFAHPDDEAFSVAGSFAKYAKVGVQTALVTATFGQVGSTRHIKKDQDLGKVRKAELEKCAKLLKIRHLYLLGYPDGQLHHANQTELTIKIEKIIKMENPNVIITFGPDGITGHVDHVVIGTVTTKVFTKVCNKKYQRLLYVAPIIENDRNLKPELTPNLSVTGQKYITRHKRVDIDVVIDISQVWQTKLAAIKCHFSQDDVRQYFKKIKKRPVFEETFILKGGSKFKQKPASDFFQV